MKSLILRSSVALACALSLAACGGSSGNLLLGGSVQGLTKSGLVLQNKSGPLLPVTAGSTSFFFNELIGNDEDFDVEIATQPPGAHCTTANNKGKSGAFNVNTVAIVCVTDTHKLGGEITGLDVNGLVLVNGDDSLAVAAGAPGAKIVFNLRPVADGAPYGVTVLKQPTGRTCSVQNGVGTMDKLDIGSVLVECK